MCGFDGYMSDKFNKDKINELIIDTIEQFIQYPPEIIGKNDIKVSINNEYYKIIGQAFKLGGINGNRYKHHFSGLINSDFGLIKRYLQQDQSKNISKGTKSNISNVKNMYDIRKEEYSDTPVNEFIAYIFNDIINRYIIRFPQNKYQKIYIVGNNYEQYDLNNKGTMFFNDFGYTDIKTFLEVDQIKNNIKCITDDNYVKNTVMNDLTHEFRIRKEWGSIYIGLVVDYNTNLIINSNIYCDIINTDIVRDLQFVFHFCLFTKKALLERIDNIGFTIDTDNLKIINDIIMGLFIKN